MNTAEKTAVRETTPTLAKDLAALFKLRLASLVVLSSNLGYFLAVSEVNWLHVFALSLGGFLLTGASNGFNQVWEKDIDKLMARTQNRPLPTGRMGITTALIASSIAGIAGLLMLYIFLPTLCAVLGALALFTYVCCYTPMKAKSPIAVWIGAFPGAIPPMLGYVAGAGAFGLAPGLLFASQFVWQFPHFWAIAWVANNDYLKAGYNMLPLRSGKNKKSSLAILISALLLLPAGALPYFMPLQNPMVGEIALVVSIILALGMIWYAAKLHKTQDDKTAKILMFASFIYLPILQIIYVIDKI